MNVKKYLTFKGRINRKIYLYLQLIFLISYIFFAIYKPDNLIQSLLFWSILLFRNFIGITTSVQRLHDINTPGIVLLIPMILGLVGQLANVYILLLIACGFYCHLMITKGTYGPNKYGNDPLNHTTEYVTLLNEI
ncbi:DUF805 domain-containing protein [Wukongibacter baidiensis]|uniref:DUF805 domain-containing protein n=1 Tax=Wukongibacter baidiensis TaxID=1723361 RepID=UPI003D7F6A3C